MDKIKEFFLDILRELCIKCLTGIFNNLNTKVNDISDMVGQTPQGFNETIFDSIQSISDTAILPVAGLILTGVLCYEVINLVNDKNTMQNVDTWMFVKIFLKMFVCVYLLSHVFEIVMAVFDVAQNTINKITDMAGGDSLKISEDLINEIRSMENIGELIMVMIIALLMNILMIGASIAIYIVLMGRVMRIYMYSALGAIPFATFGHKEWRRMGENYVYNIISLAFQPVLMIICVAMYTALVQSLGSSGDIVGSIIEMASCSILLVIALFQTGRISQSVFNAH